MHALNRYRNANSLPALFSAHIEPYPKPSLAALRRNRTHLFHESVTNRAKRICGAALHHMTSTALADIIRGTYYALRGQKSGFRLSNGYVGVLTDLSAANLAEHFTSGLLAGSGLSRASLQAPEYRRVVDLTTPHIRQPSAFSGTFSCDTNTDYVIARANAERHFPYSEALLHGFGALADAGLIHSVDMRDENGTLVGGLFGVSSGRVFIVQGLFTATSDQQTHLLDQVLHILKGKKFILVDLTSVPTLSSKDEESMDRDDFTLCVAAHKSALRMDSWTNFAPTNALTQPSPALKMAA